MAQDNRPISEIWYECAERWTEAEAAANLLEETKSAVYSQMAMRKDAKSVAERELKTKASPEWEDHVRKICDARKHANKLKVQTEYLKMRYFEAAGQAANERVMSRL